MSDNTMTDDTNSGLPESQGEGQVPWDLLSRYLAGESSAREAQDVERWAMADPARARLLDELRATWSAAGAAAPSYDVEGILRRSKRRRSGLQLETQTPAARRHVRITPAGIAVVTERSRWISLAAAVLVVGFGIWGWTSLPFSPGAAKVPERELATGVGQRLVVRLGDGTRVTLAPGSHLRYPDPDVVGRPPRMVTLDGEAVFDVVHDEAHPFTVRAGQLVTRDVGTRFAVRAYASDASPEVVVADGAVTVQLRSESARSAPKPLLLHAAERARADAAGDLTRDVDVDTAVAMAWTSGRLVFHAAPMREVVPELRRWYGIDVRLGDSALASRRLTASFTREPVASVLASVAAAVNARTEHVDAATVFRVAQ